MTRLSHEHIENIRDQLDDIDPYDEVIARVAQELLAEVDALEKERDTARTEVTSLVLKFGGKNAGHVGGATNCSSCRTLTNDYYFVGKGYLCEECWDKFPGVILSEVREKERTEILDTIQSLLNKVNMVTAYYRHQGATSPRDLDNLVDRQIEVEKKLAEFRKAGK